MSENGYLPGFTADICISYSHLDNHHIDVRGSLWVDNFHRELQALVSASIGHPVMIWRETESSSSSELPEENAERLRKTGVLVAIVSPAYTASDRCKREREVFVESRPGSGTSKIVTPGVSSAPTSYRLQLNSFPRYWRLRLASSSTASTRKAVGPAITCSIRDRTRKSCIGGRSPIWRMRSRIS